MPSFHATAGKLPQPRKEPACYLWQMGPTAMGEVCLCAPCGWKGGKYILRVTVWFNWPAVNLAKTCLHLAIFVDYSSLGKHQGTEDNREGNHRWGQRRQNSMKGIHAPVHSHKSTRFRLTCPFQVDPGSELQGGHTKYGTLELQGALRSSSLPLSFWRWRNRPWVCKVVCWVS